MSDKPEDFHPPPTAECNICEREFTLSFRGQTTCAECIMECDEVFPGDDDWDFENGPFGVGA